MVATADKIHCGIAGWSYDDWQGYVFTPGIKDKLRFIAAFVDVIEINSSFYRPPSPKTAQSWMDRTADLPDFFFTAKIHQDVTHGGRIEPGMTAAFQEAFAPLAKAGRLRHLLAQFRWDFADTPAGRTHLAAIRDAYGGLTNLTFELRHNTWQSPRALAYLTELGVSVANLDYPTSRNSFNLHRCTVGEHAYLRLHGRNAKAWFNRAAGRDETYNYLYDRKELDGVVKRAMEIADLSKSLTLVANNHYRGKEAVNALEIKAMVTGQKVPVPPKLLERYPDLERFAVPAKGPVPGAD